VEPNASGVVARLAKAAARKDYGAVESLWLELLEAEALPADELARVLGGIVDAGDGARALDLVLALAPELIRASRYAEALPLLRAVAPAANANEEVRAALLDCYRHARQEVPHLGACLDRSGLLAADDLGAAVAALDKLLSYREGDYFYHPAGWGVGSVKGFDPLTARATVDFERKLGHQVPIENIEGMFVRLPPDSFLVLRKTDPARLAQVATDDPARLVRMALEALDGRVSCRALRDLIEGVAIPADAWSKWWAAARAALKRDPYITIGTGSNPILTLRAQPLTYDEAMSGRFARLKDLRHLTEALAEYAQHMGNEADPEAFLLPAARTIAARIPAERNAGEAFEAASLLTRLDADAGPFPAPEQIVEQHRANPLPLLNGLTGNATRSQVFRMLRDRAEKPAELCRLVLLGGPDSLWDAAADGLPADGEPPTIQTFAEEVLANPRRNLTLFAWVCRNLLLRRWTTPATPAEVFERLLTEGDVLARRKAHQRGEWTPFDQGDEMADIRQALRAGDLAYFDAMLDAMSEAEAVRLHFRIRQSSVLPEQFARILERKMVRRFPKLLVEEEHKAEAPAVEYIYNTAAAIARRRKEHDHVVNVLIPKNSADIAKAKDSGDLTDNADFRAAIQEQHVLNAKAIEMGEELQRARPIEPAMVHTEHVSIGSRVTVENAATGERRTLSILGPWDSDAEHGVIAYVAPLAQALLRRRVGDEVPFSHAGEAATYRIVEVASTFDAPAEGDGE